MAHTLSLTPLTTMSSSVKPAGIVRVFRVNEGLPMFGGARFHSVATKAIGSNTPATKLTSIVCADCDGNGFTAARQICKRWSLIKPLSSMLAFRTLQSPHVTLISNTKSLRFIHLKAAAAASDENSDEEAYEEYEVEIEQPYGLRFAKGRDGGTYIDAIAPGLSADKTGKFTVGDKVIATSAVFGTELWPAAEYGRTMYTIRQRIGPLFMKMQKRFGNLDYGSGQLSEKEIIRAERNSGFISNRVREIQLQNYQRKMEQKKAREKDLSEGLRLYKAGKYEEAREKFESVLGSMPTPDEASVASYNVACCYSKLNQIQASLSALEDALKQGYEDFKRIRNDPDLANLRTSPDFETLMKRFDESFINESAVNAIKSLFGLFKN